MSDFEFDKNNIKAPVTINFTNKSKNATDFLWDFGDGKTSTEEEPSHHYQSQWGDFLVSLTATGKAGSHSSAKKLTIIAPFPEANFSFSPLEPTTADSIQFNNLSAYEEQYSWDFGDGQTSNLENPKHSYSTQGDYNVKLTVIGEGGEDSMSKNIAVTAPPFNIVPGERIGDFYLGEDLESLIKKIDEEYFNHFMIRRTDGSYLHLMTFSETGVSFFVVNRSSNLYNNDVPDSFTCFPPFEGNTEKGITFGSLLTEVEAAYGPPDDISSSGSYSYALSIGISFWADDNKIKVDEIYIQKPGSFPEPSAGFFKSIESESGLIKVHKSELIKK